ncbi:hypothetical protein NQ317_001566, partial [Molorchus minor]
HVESSGNVAPSDSQANIPISSQKANVRTQHIPVSSSSNSEPITTSTPPPLNAMTSTYRSQTTVLLSTCIIEVRDYLGNYQLIRALLDSASQACFISEPCLKRLGLSRRRSSAPVLGLNHSSSSTNGLVHCIIKPVGLTEPCFSIEALVLPKLCADMPSIQIDKINWPHISNIKLADNSFNKPGPIDMLIGAELYPHILKSGRICGAEGQPSALDTIFGWVLLGKIHDTSVSENSNSLVTCCTSTFPLEAALMKFWELESVASKIHISPEDEQCEELFKETLSRDNTGRFIVSLPFRQGEPDLGDTYTSTLRRFLSLESRLSKNTSFNSYIKRIGNLESQTYPEASRLLLNDTYVDDVVSGASSLTSAISLRDDLIKLLRLGGFELRKWASNSPQFLSSLPESAGQGSLSFDKR